MNENTLLKRFFEDGIEFDPDKQFGLSHKVRIRRIREIVLLMRKHHVMDGLSPTELRDILVDLGPSSPFVRRSCRRRIAMRFPTCRWTATLCHSTKR